MYIYIYMYVRIFINTYARTRVHTLWRSAPQGSPRTPAKFIADTIPGLIVRILKFWF